MNLRCEDAKEYLREKGRREFQAQGTCRKCSGTGGSITRLIKDFEFNRSKIAVYALSNPLFEHILVLATIEQRIKTMRLRAKHVVWVQPCFKTYQLSYKILVYHMT